jgi:predicted small metal-binding protein
MTKVDSAEAQASFPELLAHIGEGGNRVVIEKEGHAMAESNSEFVTMEEVVAHYNKLHGTDFTIESIINDLE